MNKKKIFLKSTLSLVLVITMFCSSGIVANAAIPNNIRLYYTKGAPSSDVCTSKTFTYVSVGNSSVGLRISTFTTAGPYIKIVTKPELKTSNYYRVTKGYIDVPYAGGARPPRGYKVLTKTTLHGYSGYGSVYVYGIITEADG
jgi:hypothetical protein